MADFVAPQFQNPDLMASYLRGQQGATQAAAAPIELAGAQQDQQYRGLQMDQLKIAMQSQSMYQKIAQGLITPDGTQQPQSASPGIQNGPQGSVTAQEPGSYNGSVGGLNPNTLQALALLRGDDPLKTAEGVQNYQLEQKKRQLAGPMNLAETVASSPQADMIIKNNPDLQQRWIKTAPLMGLDPFKDLTPENARRVAIFGYNNMAAQAGLPPKPMPDSLKTTGNALGGVYQTDQLSGKMTQVKGDEPLQKVIGPNGQPTLVPASKAIGMTPFNESIFGAGNISNDAKEMAYQFAKVNGGALPPGMTFRGNAEKAAMANFIADRMKQDGDTASALTARGQATKATLAVVKDFQTGKEAQSLNGINTAVKHMESLDPLIDALGNGDIKAFNKIGNTFQEQTGAAAPTNYAALKEFVGGEVAKAVLPGGGGEAERKALTAPLDAANSPEQLKQAVQTIKTALAGKTEALRNQWDVGTNGTQGNFDKFLLPSTKKALGINEAKAGPVQVNSPEEAMKLAPGTIFLTPDGRRKVR